jgi:hypothetical protein
LHLISMIYILIVFIFKQSIIRHLQPTADSYVSICNFSEKYPIMGNWNF